MPVKLNQESYFMPALNHYYSCQPGEMEQKDDEAPLHLVNCLFFCIFFENKLNISIYAVAALTSNCLLLIVFKS